MTNADQDVLDGRYRSGIDLKTYQLQPLVRSLEMSFALMLIVASAGRVEKW